MSKKSLVELYYDTENEYKEKYGDKTVIFLQKGKFYELYSVSESFPKLCDILNIICSRVNKKLPITKSNPQMAGFQTQFVDRYIKVLLEKNYKIVIIDEISIKEKGKNVDRAVTRVVSSSTYLESQEVNPLLIIYYTSYGESKSCVSISWVNLSTGKIVLYPEYG